MPEIKEGSSMTRIQKILCLMPVFALVLAMNCSHAFDLPEEALRLLARAATDPCSICAKQTREKAFRILNERFVPGYEIGGRDRCRLIRTGLKGENELSPVCRPSAGLMETLKEEETPLHVVFRFHTPGSRLIGISEKDYTHPEIPDLLNGAPPETVYEGRLRLIPYKYGDGPTYNYSPQTNTLQFHCLVSELKPASSE